MTYKKIFNELDQNGLIEKILLESNWDYIGLMKGIQNLEDFINTDIFNNMQYWININANLATCITCREYSNLFKTDKRFNYMFNLYNARTIFIPKAKRWEVS